MGQRQAPLAAGIPHPCEILAGAAVLPCQAAHATLRFTAPILWMNGVLFLVEEEPPPGRKRLHVLLSTSVTVLLERSYRQTF